MMIPPHHNFLSWVAVPAYLRTRGQWADVGYRVVKRAPVCGTVYEQKTQQRFKLYHARDVCPIQSEIAAGRRWAACMQLAQERISRWVETLPLDHDTAYTPAKIEALTDSIWHWIYQNAVGETITLDDNELDVLHEFAQTALRDRLKSLHMGEGVPLSD